MLDFMVTASMVEEFMLFCFFVIGFFVFRPVLSCHFRPPTGHVYNRSAEEVLVTNEGKCLKASSADCADHETRPGWRTTLALWRPLQRDVPDTAKEHALRIRAAMQGGNLEEVTRHLLSMHHAGHKVPGACVAAVIRLAYTLRQGKVFLRTLPGELLDVKNLFELAQNMLRTDLLSDMHERARAERITLSSCDFEALLQAYKAVTDSLAVELFEVTLLSGFSQVLDTYWTALKIAAESGRLQEARKVFNGSANVIKQVSMIEAAGHDGDVQSVMSLIGDCEGTSLEFVAYCHAYEACVQCHDTASAENVLERMVHARKDSSLRYNTYLKTLFSSKHQPVEASLAQMRRQGLRPNAMTYNSIFVEMMKENNLVTVWKFIDLMIEDGARPNAVTCALFAYHIEYAGTLDVDRIFSLFAHVGFTLNDGVMCHMLDCCTRLSRVHCMDKLYEYLRARSISLHAKFIKAFGRVRRLDRMWTVWSELKAHNVAVSADVYASMVDASLVGRDVEGALSVFRSMKLALPDSPETGSVGCGLVRTCLRNRQTRLAMDIFDDIKHMEACSVKVYNNILDVLCKNGEMDSAQSLFREMLLNSVSDYNSFSIIIRGQCAHGDLMQALQVFRQMQHHGVKPDLPLFHTVLMVCAHQEKRSVAELLLQDMTTAGVAPSNATLCILLKLYGRAGDLKKAFEVVDCFPVRYGFKLNSKVYVALMSVCVSAGKLIDALALFDEMTDEGCAADAEIFDLLLEGCIRHKEVCRAVQLLHDILEREPRVSIRPDTAERALQMCASHGFDPKAGFWQFVKSA